VDTQPWSAGARDRGIFLGLMLEGEISARCCSRRGHDCVCGTLGAVLIQYPMAVALGAFRGWRRYSSSPRRMRDRRSNSWSSMRTWRDARHHLT